MKLGIITANKYFKNFMSDNKNNKISNNDYYDVKSSSIDFSKFT